MHAVKIPIQEYLKKEKIQPIYKIEIRPQFSPFDINLQFIMEEGWSIADRLRFHFETGIEVDQDHPLKSVFDHLKPHITIRRFDREEDSFITIFIQLDGGLDLLSNDKEFAQKYLHGLFLNCPPSYHSSEELDIIEEGWVVDERIHAMFMGLLEGALGWDISHQIPPSIRQSLEEANKALVIANYRSCVVMCRRARARAHVKLPDVKGIEVARKMRKQHDDIRLIIITGYTEIADGIETINVGIDEILIKPIEPDELLRAVKESLVEHEKVHNSKVSISP